MSEPSQDYLHAKSPSILGQQPQWPKDQRPPAIKYTKRFDSGVADLDQDGQREISIRPMATGGPPQGRMSEYDYATKGGHLYEELPGKYPYIASYPAEEVLPPPKPIDDQEQCSWPESTISGNSRTAIINNNPESRYDRLYQGLTGKRNNPLYDAIQNKYPSPPSNPPPSRSKHSSRHIVCLCVLTIFALVIAVISLAVAIYVLMEFSPNESPSTTADGEKVLLAQYQQLQMKYSELAKNYTELSEILLFNPTNGSGGNVTLATKVARNMMELKSLGRGAKNLELDIDQLKVKVLEIDQIHGTIQMLGNNITENSNSVNTVYTNITTQLSQTNSHIQQQLLNISKMEGPQGLQGQGNLSACYYKNFSSILSPSFDDDSTTSWAPSADMLRDYIVMSSTCSVHGGTRRDLETMPYASITNAQQYRCRCGGTISGENVRTCYVHLWMCPRLS